MKEILHLERKFTAKTETFIVNQINTITKFDVIISTIKSLKNLYCEKTIVTPSIKDYLSQQTKVLFPYTANNLTKELSQYEFSLIHTHYISDALFFHSLTKKYRIPKVCSAYGYDVSRFPKSFFGLSKYLLKSVFKEYDIFLAMSEDMKNDLIDLGCPPAKILIHYHGINTDRFIFESRDYRNNKANFNLLTVGTLNEKKAHYLVIEALYLLKTKFSITNINYNIVGTGNKVESLKNLVKQRGLEEMVIFHGHVPYEENVKFYNEADIFALTSITSADNDKEGIPGVIVEAMANGLPIISSFHAGIPSVITSYQEGILVEENNIIGIAEALKILIENESLREKLGKKAKLKALDELNFNAKTQQLELIYENLILRSYS